MILKRLLSNINGAPLERTCNPYGPNGHKCATGKNNFRGATSRNMIYILFMK